MRIILNGAGGAMGKMTLKCLEDGGFDASAAALVDISFTTGEAPGHYRSLDDFKGQADVMIDFSNHKSAEAVSGYCVKNRMPLVMATTGHSGEEAAMVRRVADYAPLIFTANVSLGVAVLRDLVKKAVSAFPDADVEIIEAHHNRKADAPSGTALAIAESVKEVRSGVNIVCGRNGASKREKNDVSISSVRAGNIAGIHEVIITNGLETISLKHQAESRELFASGALRAAAFLVGKPAGMYSMDDVLAEGK